MKARFLLLAAVALTTLCAVSAIAITLTGNVDTDLVGQPGVITRDCSLGPPTVTWLGHLGAYTLDQEPLTAGVEAIAGAVVPSGFHVSKLSVLYSCSTDTLYVGYDVSNPSTFDPGPGPLPTGLSSRAWDADGDGNPCTLTNPFVNSSAIGTDMPNNAGISEKYQILLDMNRDGFDPAHNVDNVVATAYDDGSIAGSDPTAVDVPGPCGPGDVIHLTLKTANGINLLALGATISIVYGQDIEFKITGLPGALAAIPPPNTRAGLTLCDFNLQTFADTDYDQSGEVHLQTDGLNFPTLLAPAVSCSKTAVPDKACLPFNVTYTLTATNTGTANETITITDPTLGINKTCTGVAPGGTCVATAVVTYGVDKCGAPDIVNTMTAHASQEACCPGTGPNDATCSSSATVSFPKPPTVAVTCSKTALPDRACLPFSVTYTLTATNTGTDVEDITITDPDILPAGKTCTAVPVGGTCVATVVVPYGVDKCGAPDLVNTMTATANAAGCCAAGAAPATCSSSATVSFRCDCDGHRLFQAYPGRSNRVSSFHGLNGSGPDVIKAVPGVLQIVPGTNWSNYVSAFAAGIPYQLKNVVLRKSAPEYIQCSEVFSSGTLAVQQGTPNVRLWWPLLYEVPGTTFTLTITYGTPMWADPDHPGQPTTVHTEVWTWEVDANVASLGNLLDVFHEFPFGLDEVPLISDEVLYGALKAKVAALQVILASPAPLTPAQVAAAGDILVDFEMEVADACIVNSPATPRPTGGDTGIANPECFPACCKLLVDAEFIGFDLGIFQPGK